jgi:hypothetical protein
MPDLTADDIEAHSSKERYTETWSRRRNFQGDNAVFKDAIHEILEIHDGTDVTIIVDRQWPVANFKNPHPTGRYPFQIFRPTELEHQFAGKGEIEPMRDLQYEMNALRTDRRWNALFVMHQSYFYEDGTIDPKAIKKGPGMLNPVNSGGSLRDILMPMTVGDIPFSSYRETEEMKGDIDRTTGISDPASGVGDAGQTATGVQLVQAAAGVRIQNKTRRLELELIRPQAQDFLALNQQRLAEPRDIPVPAPASVGEPDRRWTWFSVGPAQMAGEFDAIPDGGSTAPENVPQMRQDAQMFLSLAQHPMADGRKMFVLALRNMGIDQPEAYLSSMQDLPPQTLDFIQAALVDQLSLPPDQVHALLADATEQAMQQAQEQQMAPGAPQAPGQGPPEQQQAA